MKKIIIFVVVIFFLIACESTTVESQVKIVAIDTDNRIVFVVNATTESAEIRQQDILTYTVQDDELLLELRNNIGGLYAIKVRHTNTQRILFEATRINGT